MISELKPPALLAALALVAAACDDVEAGADRLRERGGEALERIEVQRERVEAELEERLREASAELGQLRGAGEQGLVDLERELEAQRELAEARLAELRRAGGEAWEGALLEARREVEELRRGASEASPGD